MGRHNLETTVASESIEMYLLRIALLQQEEQPVPIPRLAQELCVSPVSANEMSKKLVEKGLVEYAPYKGVTLTGPGEALAQQILRYRRLWEVFFVENLGLDPAEADEIACRFEHVTPETLAERLDAFLDYPVVCPHNEPIPRSDDTPLRRLAQPLTAFGSGLTVQVVAIESDPTTQAFLHQQGLRPGTLLEILAAAVDEALLLDVAGRRLSVTGAIAKTVSVVPLL